MDRTAGLRWEYTAMAWRTRGLVSRLDRGNLPVSGLSKLQWANIRAKSSVTTNTQNPTGIAIEWIE